MSRRSKEVEVILEMAKHLESTMDVDYRKIIPTKVNMILIPIISTKRVVEVIINPSHYIKKKPNGTITINKKAITYPPIAHTYCQVQLVTLRMKKRKEMLVQTTSTLLKVMMIQDQIQIKMMMMRCLVTVYLSHATITFQMKIGMLMPTWSRQRC
ncbi:unnamed protein product [Linum trigynum]|uniref:Uncharacterized protein n=1 Tax=Linum trigynum TaxID=586398 RepID=A0AAV2G713_9ROSI